jgi:hypothetical protein
MVPMSNNGILIWNVRGLDMMLSMNWSQRRRLSFVCRETKLAVISPFDIMQIVGPGFEYFYLPTEQTRGGTVIMWCSSMWSASNTSVQVFYISVKFKSVTWGGGMVADL